MQCIWTLDAKVKVFHESTLCFMKCLETVFHEILRKKNFTAYFGVIYNNVKASHQNLSLNIFS